MLACLARGTANCVANFPGVAEDHFRSVFRFRSNAAFEDGSSPFSAKNSLWLPCCQTSKMFRAGLRSTWNAFPRPAPTSAWQTFFRTNQQKRTLINASRDNHWPRSPLLPEGKGFNWDAFRWTNYRVASTLLGFGLM